MERLDFASVMAVLRRNIDEDMCSNQMDLLCTLFRDLIDDPFQDVELDNGQVCRWVNGLAKLSPKISGYYQENRSQRKLAKTIEQAILPMMPDPAMAVQELHDLLVQAPNVSPQMKAQLAEGLTFADEALFIMEVLCFAMRLRFEKRDVRNRQLLTPGNLSPAVVDYIFDTSVPKPCRWFLGRDRELEQLHELLIDQDKVFLHGIPGIGKSELAKMYAKRHSKEYTNILYVNYSGDLKQDVTDMDFADDRPDETEEARFRRHNRFLRSLKEDTLLIVDNFNAVAAEDEFLDVVLRYRCRILFTTRSRYEHQTCLEITELSREALLELMGVFYEKAEKKRTIMEEIIDLLHGHTFAVELAARLLARGMLRSKTLVKKLRVEKAAMDAEDQIGSTKDGKSRKATYYDHIHSLFAMYRLSRGQQEILRGLTLTPADGMSAKRFGLWLKLWNLNAVNDLIEMGLIQPRNRREIRLHPMIREVAVEELKPSVRNCKKLLDSLEFFGLLHGMELSWYRQAFETVENIIATIQKDDMTRYLLFLKNAMPNMDKYEYRRGIQAIMDEMEALLADEAVGTDIDRAFLLDFRAASEKDPRKAIRLDEEALAVLGEVNPGNAHLTSNIHSNLGTYYRAVRDLEQAEYHMETAIHLLEEHGLAGCHDSIMQICNYAQLLTDKGESQRGYGALEKLSAKLEALHMGHSLDYGMVQQVMGSVAAIRGDVGLSHTHRRKALEIYEIVFENEPHILEQKRKELGIVKLEETQFYQKIMGQ